MARTKDAAGKGTGDGGLQQDLRDFVSARPHGWDHNDWLSFLDHLRERGHDTSDSEGIGRALERERLAVVLQQIPGVGPARQRSLAETFESLWGIRQASVEDIASRTNVPRSLAERIKETVG